jgi:hypothetical protein
VPQKEIYKYVVFSVYYSQILTYIVIDKEV